MIAALRLILAGGTYLPPRAFEGRSAKIPSGDDSLDRLTPRQFLVLKLALQGKSDELIGNELGLPKTIVRENLTASFKALGVENRTDAIFEAARAGVQFGGTA